MLQSEHDIQAAIRLALSEYAMVFRVNVGRWKSEDGRFVSTGVPVGFSDLFGYRYSDGKAFFIEVKKSNGKISIEQQRFINAMKKGGALADVARSVEDALGIIGVTT